ncbi:MAG: hypothetical protein P8O70_16335 [SAR324 cluster bacterium]|jgi:hypothetical protein|nr:hypothetical protein [SAR324 cluster bacterium]
MKIIASAKVTKGYEHWKNAIESEDHKKTREDSGIFFLEYGYQEETGRVFIVEELESAESGAKFLANNPNYVDEVGIDPSTLQVVALED